MYFFHCQELNVLWCFTIFTEVTIVALDVSNLNFFLGLGSGSIDICGKIGKWMVMLIMLTHVIINNQSLNHL